MPEEPLVRDVMKTDVVTLTPDEPVAAAADKLAEHGYGAMPVVDENGRLVGLLRDSDLIISEARVHVPTFLSIPGVAVAWPGSMKHVEAELEKIAGATVGEIMDDDPHTIGPDDTLEELATRMHERDVTHLPVVNADGRVVGIVARGDIVRYIARTT